MTEDEMRAAVADEPNTAAKVRALKAMGVANTEIGVALNISYQHVYSVLKRAGMTGRAAEAKDANANAALDVISLEVDPDGRLALTPELVERYGLRPGSTVLAQPQAHGLALMSREGAIAYALASARRHLPDHASLIDTLLGGQPGQVQPASG